MQQNTIINFFIYLTGICCICLGAIVIFGWYTHSYLIVQLRPELSPMQINTAISFILSGSALIFLIQQRYQLTHITAYTLLVISTLTLAEYLFDTQLGIDEFFIKSFIVQPNNIPGRMAVNTTISFICAGISFLLLTMPYNHNRMITNLICTFIILSLGTFSILSYTFNITTRYGLSQWVKMALHTAAGMIILSIGLILVMYLKKKIKRYLPILPMITTFSILIASFLGWQIIKKNQELYLSELLKVNLDNIKNAVESHVRERTAAFSRITYRWINRENTPENEWRDDASHYIQDQPGYRSIMYVDKNYQVRWVEPLKEGKEIIGYNFYQDVSSRNQMLASIKENTPLFTNQIDLIQGGSGIILFNPIIKHNQFDGLMVGAIDTQVMLDAIVRRYILNGYNTKITDENEVLYHYDGSDYDFYNEWKTSTDIILLGQTWRIVLWPSTILRNQIITSWQPTLTLLIGILIALLSGLLVQMLQLRQIGANKLMAARLELADAHERLKGIIEGSEDLIAAIDLNHRFIVFNATYKNEVFRLFRINLEVGMSLNVILDKLSEDNKKKTLYLWQKALSGTSFTVIETFEDKKLGNLDYEIHFNPIRDASGNIIGANHIATDVRPRLQGEKKLAESKKELESMVTNLEKQNHELIVLEELMSILQSCTSIKYAIETIGIYIKIILKKTSGIIYLNSIIDPCILNKELSWGNPISKIASFKQEDCWALIRNHIHAVNNLDEGVTCNHLKKGEMIPGAYVCLPLHAQNEILGLLYVELEENSTLNQRLIYLAQIISEQMALSIYNIKLRDELRSQSTHDTLTGLYNRRFFEEYINKQLPTHKAFGLLLIDVDFFKKINDVYGHLVGDKVLRQVAEILNEMRHPNDLVSRWGGEEFMIYLAEKAKTDVYARAEMIRQAIEKMCIKYEEKSLSVTISIGVAFYPADGMELDELTSKADEALYQAKHSGRNRVC